MNEYDVIGINQCRCLPKAELVAVWVRFGVQLDYSCRLKSASSTGEKCVIINPFSWFENSIQVENVVSQVESLLI